MQRPPAPSFDSFLISLPNLRHFPRAHDMADKTDFCRSPGRGKYGNMGSKPISHEDARLLHHAQGSWKHFNLKVELGKFCRTAFGLCRDWSKVSP